MLIVGLALLAGIPRLAKSMPDDIIYYPLIVAGDPDGTPADSPANRIIDNTDTSSPFAGVGSVRADVGSSTYIGTGTPIDRLHVLTAGHVVDINDNGTPDEDADHYTFNLNFGSDFSSTHVASVVTAHLDFTGFNNPSVNDDLAILTLRYAIPEEVPIYDLWRTPLSVPGETITLVGYGRSGDGVSGYTTGASWTVKRLGENDADMTFPDDEGSGVPEVWRADFDGPNGLGQRMGGLTLGNDVETTVGGGDSGGPGFILDDGQYYLATVNNFSVQWSSSQPAPEFGSGLGGILVPAYAAWIDSVLAEPLLGDVTGDDFVGGDDLSVILTNWGLSGQTREQGDLTGEGFVGGDDYSEVLDHWGTGIPPESGVLGEPPVGMYDPMVGVPEPLTAWLVLAGAAGLLLRRKGQQSAGKTSMTSRTH